jgi:glycosyltransferase involved in cell wall biosynthesis
MAVCLLAITDPGCEVSTRYRVTQFEPYLLQRQIHLRTVAWPRLEAEQRALVESAAEADVVLLQRYLPSRRWLREVRRRARRLVYDFDDAVIYFESSRRQPRLMLDRWWRFQAMMRHCDAVSAGNSYLASLAQLSAQAGRVSVVPTTLEWERYEDEPAPHEAAPVVGWIGTRSTLPYLEQLRRALEQASVETGELTVRVIADQAPDLGKTRVELIRWEAATEVRELKRLRAGLAPLPDDAWTRGKCGLRLLQYLAAGVPAVASPVGMQAQVIAAGAALSACTEADWHDALRRVLKDDPLAADVAARGKQLVREQFSTQAWAERLRACWCGSLNHSDTP